MIKKTKLSKEQLKKLLIDHSILEGIRLGRYTEVIENDSPSKSIPKGRSLIISYYQSGQYICTKHELKGMRGDTVHQDVEAVFIDGIRYERLEP
jgi:hypothetical protein